MFQVALWNFKQKLWLSIKMKRSTKHKKHWLIGKNSPFLEENSN